MSDIANDIVDQVFAGDKSAAVDTVGTAIQDRAYELIQQKKIEIAQQWGFDLDQTGQGNRMKYRIVFPMVVIHPKTLKLMVGCLTIHLPLKLN